MGKLNFLINPQSIAVIGASGQAGKVGYTVMDNIIKSGFKGKIIPINPKSPEIMGHKAFKSVTDIPVEYGEKIDMGVIIIPSKLVINTAKQCAARGFKSLVVITAGFKEVGGEGVAMEAELVRICEEAGIRVVGPNVLGLITPYVNASFAGRQPNKGNIAFLSQSGAMLTAILDWAVTSEIGFSNFISLGNKCDVDEVDLISEVAEDPNTSVILLYLESVNNGSKFLDVVPKAIKNKPVIILKSGTSAAGAAAASSHTGALAGNDIAFDIAFDKCGVMRARTMSELFDLARLFSTAHVEASSVKSDKNNFVIITNAGGPGIITTDAFETYGLDLYKIPDAVKDRLRAVLPAEASVKNPVDIVGDAPPKRYADAIDVCFSAPECEDLKGALILVTPQAQTDPEGVAKLLVEMRAKYPNKIFVSAFMGGISMVQPVKDLAAAKIPCYDFPEPCVASTKALCYYQNVKSAPIETEKAPKYLNDKINARIQEIFAEARADGRNSLLSHETSEIFTLLGVNAPRTMLAHSSADAGKMAEEIGYPVVMKIVSPEITHKSDCGGVKLWIKSAEEASAAYDEIMHNAATRGPKGANLKGVEIQKMVDFKKYEKTTEVIVGMNRDSTWGPMLMVGKGGIYANYEKDVAFEMAYLYNEDVCLKQLARTKIYSILKGVRGQPESDIDNLVGTMMRLAELVNKHSDIAELDMNPLLVFEKKEGENTVFAVDVKIVLKKL